MRVCELCLKIFTSSVSVEFFQKHCLGIFYQYVVLSTKNIPSLVSVDLSSLFYIFPTSMYL